MLYILFSPSESKRQGGDGPPLNRGSFLWPELFDKRAQIIDAYENFLQNATPIQKTEFFGLKYSSAAIDYDTVSSGATMSAIARYNGVAYEKLDFYTLPQKAKEYTYSRTVIFSNLFGPVLGGDMLPDYRFKQGAKLPNIAAEKHYKEHFSQALDKMLEDAQILDLRAGFYDKFYTPKQSCLTMKFLQNGKVVSHYAKAYRGEMLRAAVLNGAGCIEQILGLEIDGLKIEEIKKKGDTQEAIYSIIS